MKLESPQHSPFPAMAKLNDEVKIPLSFVVVHYSDKYFHNILRSECLRNPINELVTVHNEGNIFYDNYCEAVTSGLSKAQHDLIVVVYEDVLLPDGWQPCFEVSLQALEREDPNWGVLGSVGMRSGELIGHWRDSVCYINSFTGQKFISVTRLDEHLLIFSRKRMIKFDTRLPGRNFVAWDVSLTAQAEHLRLYVVDAPTIHKYADAKGKLVEMAADLRERSKVEPQTAIVDRQCSEEYLFGKWPHLRDKLSSSMNFDLSGVRKDTLRILDEPIILLGVGGGGSRLLSRVGLDVGLFLGDILQAQQRSDHSGDSMEFSCPVYQGIVEKYRCKADWQVRQAIPRLRYVAAKVFLKNVPHPLWGFKLPESLLLLPELKEAFPRARFIHMVRDPLFTCLRRTHMRARLNNEIGQISLTVAYDFVGRPRERILKDSPAIRMAISTIHQIELALNEFKEPAVDYLMIRFEDVVDRPTETVEQVCRWLKVKRVEVKLEELVDRNRASHIKVLYDEDVKQAVIEMLAPLRKRLGYI